jgi:hypothetical protein
MDTNDAVTYINIDIDEVLIKLLSFQY